MTIKRWLSNKKNQRTVFIVAAIVLIWYYLKQRSKASGDAYKQLDPNAMVGGGGTGTGGRTGGGSPAGPIPDTHANTSFFTLVESGGTYSDNYAGDNTVNGQKRITANGRTYTAFYYINGIPYEDEAGKPKVFENVPLSADQFISIRKVYGQSNWASTFDELYGKGYEAWFENPGSDENLTYKTVIVNLTT